MTEAVRPAGYPGSVSTPGAAAAVTPDHDLGGVLRIASFRRLWTALSLSSLGDWLGLLALTALAPRLAADGYAAANLAIAGVFILMRRRAMLRELAVVVVTFLSLLLANAAFNNWHGGSGIGPRYILPVVPFLAVPMFYAVVLVSEAIWRRLP